MAPDRVPAAAARADDASTASCWSSDEVQSGMGRTGKMFAIEHSGVEPDIVAIAKGIASGLPLGVASARADLMTWPPGAHASTFGGNPVSCAAALATIKLLKERLVANAADVGGHLMAGLKALAGQASADRRRARPRPDDRRRAGARSPDEGARRPTSATPSSPAHSRAACWCSARGRTRSASRRRWC